MLPHQRIQQCALAGALWPHDGHCRVGSALVCQLPVLNESLDPALLILARSGNDLDLLPHLCDCNSLLNVSRPRFLVLSPLNWVHESTDRGLLSRRTWCTLCNSSAISTLHNTKSSPDAG